MSAGALFRAGFTELVCVTVPGGEIHPRSRLDPKSMGKAPGVLGQDRLWRGYPWRMRPPTLGEAQAWDLWGANVGVDAGVYPGIDIDVDDVELAGAIREELEATLGRAVLRYSRPGRALLMYRMAEGESIPRMRIWIDWRGERKAIEFLGSGQQYLVAGRHPSGSRYTTEPSLETLTPGDLTVVTPDDLHAARVHLAGALTLFGARVVKQQVGDPETGPLPPPESLAADEATVRELLDAVPNDFPDRESYLRVGYAVAGASGHAPWGLEAWWGWCERWEGGVNERETVELDWARMRPPYRVGVGLLEDMAREHGTVLDFEAEPPPAEPERPAVGAGAFPYSDADLAARFLRAHGDVVRFCEGLGGWARYHDGLWDADELGGVEELMGRVAREAGEEALIMVERRSQAEAIAQRCSSTHGRRAALAYAQTHPAVARPLEAFDAGPMLLNTPDGVVDLESGRLRAHDPGLMMTMQTAAGPSSAEPTRWLQFLSEATGGDDELAGYLQRLAGYALTGSIREHSLHLLWGPGGNGKSVFTNALVGLMGGYARVSPMDVFLAGQERHPTELAMLAGARLVSAQKTKEGRSWDEAKVKSLTGGDPITARFMRQDFFTFRPQFTLVLSGNAQPRLDSLDVAWRRRFHLIPFTRRPAVVDPDLPRALEGEYPAILGWAVRGALAWARDGLGVPDAVQAATDEYFRAQDPVGRWIEAACVVDPDGAELTAELYNSFRAWARAAGEPTQTERWLSVQLQEREGIAKWKHPESRRRGYQGIRLRPELEAVDIFGRGPRAPGHSANAKER